MLNTEVKYELRNLRRVTFVSLRFITDAKIQRFVYSVHEIALFSLNYL